MNCVNVIHIDIIEIWNLYDRRSVGSSHVRFCYDCSTESVSIKQPIQDKNVARRQRSSYTSWRLIAEVGVLRNISGGNKWECLMIESPIVTGVYLETRSRIGFTMYIEAGE